jgi:hypothetical protein
MAPMRFSSWKRSRILSGAQPSGGRLTRSLELQLDDAEDVAPPSNNLLPVAFPAAADVMAISSGAIRHMAPKPNTPDAETTKFVHLDLHDAELPWRYTPKSSVANVGGLEPWMVLIVGTSDELDVDRGVVRMVADAVLLGHDLNLSQRWAHVQTENGVSFSRILSPRALKPLRDHVAALVPAFTAEGGRMWSGAQRNFSVLPAFFSWRFQAAEEGDFETLAAALRLRPSGGLGIASLRYNRPMTGVDETLTLGGAITSLKNHPDEPDAVTAAREDLDELNENLVDEIPPDIVPPPPIRPIVQLPDYGGLWREDTSAAQWTKSLNDDPRHRGVAGIGLKLGVVEQESLMNAAVRQAGALQDAGQRIGFLAIGIDVSRRLWNRRLPDKDELRLRLFGPAMGRIAAEGGGSVLERVTGEGCALDPAVFSSAAQRLLRNGSARARFAGSKIDRAGFLAAANQTPDPPEKVPDGLPHIDRVAKEFGEPSLEEALGLPKPDDRLEAILAKFDGLPLDDEIIEAFAEMVNHELGLDCGASIIEFLQSVRLTTAVRFLERDLMLEAIESCLGYKTPDPVQKSGLSSALPRPAEPDGRGSIDLGKLAGIVGSVIDPNAARPPAWGRVESTITGIVPFSLSPPEVPIGLDYPTWTVVNRHEREWLLPGASSIPPHSIVALQTNPTFIDAFMVGINTQFLAEMRWRNLPAPRISTPLRMFWGHVDHGTGQREADIRPIADWPSKAFGEAGADDVGDLSHQAIRPGDTTGTRDLVIAFRTALFRRYPSTLVYLVRPRPGDDVDTLLKSPPDFADAATNRTDRRFFGPIFFGQMEPDLVFFAFDIDPDALEQLWLVLDEPPSELRFRNDRGLTHPTSADFAQKTIDRPTRVAISGAALKTQATQG